MPRSRRPAAMPRPPVTRALREFLATEAAGGVLLAAATALALLWANSPWVAGYDALWHTSLRVGLGAHEIDLDLREWVNDGLMAVFFLVVALEVKRELLLGELRDRRTAALPAIAALGGIVVPALLYLALNPSGPERAGWGVPMATDIAFALGVLALVARSIPPAARLFLLTLAIVDDIAAIVVIAVFYSDGVDPGWLAVSLGIVLVVALLQHLGVVTTPLFVVLGVLLWLALHESGVHATIAGVAMGLLAPATPALTREIVDSSADQLADVLTPRSAHQTSRMARQSVSQLEWLEHQLHGWSSFVIVPIFALANAGIVLSGGAVRDAMSSTVTLGILLGLVVGKAVGIGGATWLAIRTGVCDLPEAVRWRHLAGVACLGGIGFTVSLFITGLAFDAPRLVAEAKIGILFASLAASGLGALLLRGGGGAEPAQP